MESGGTEIDDDEILSDLGKTGLTELILLRPGELWCSKDATGELKTI